MIIIEDLTVQIHGGNSYKVYGHNKIREINQHE